MSVALPPLTAAAQRAETRRQLSVEAAEANIVEDRANYVAPAGCEDVSQLYQHALEGYNAAESRRVSIEQRATTLQGGIAIALSFFIAGDTAIVVGDHPVAAHDWRIAFAALVSLITVALAASGAFALSILGRTHNFSRPFAPARVLERAANPSTIGLTLINDLLQAAAWNADIAQWKLDRLKRSTWCFAVALLLVLVLALAFVAFAICR